MMMIASAPISTGGGGEPCDLDADVGTATDTIVRADADVGVV